MTDTYKPLPSNVTVKKSAIEGLGLFSTADTNLGTSHYIMPSSRIIRTPLGGFYNHSDNPNCEKHEDGHELNLITLKDIKAGEELTVAYTLYNIGE